MSEADTEQKEAHRIGTIHRWDPPEADWAAEYDWTRYRGPAAYPVPGDWALSIVEGDGIIWYRFPGAGDGCATGTDVRDQFDDPSEYDDLREEMATLGHEVVDEDRRSQEVTLEHELRIAGETVFRRVEPTDDELDANVAAALAAYDDGTDVLDIAVSWQSGSVPEDIREAEKQDRRKSQNQQLGDFS